APRRDPHAPASSCNRHSPARGLSMTCTPRLLAATLLLAGPAVTQAASPPPRKLPDGVYAVRRDALEKDGVLPLARGEALLVHAHRYQAKAGGLPPRFVVVGTAPDVALDLDGAPKAIEDGGEVVGILLKLRPKAAAALERLTGQRRGGSVAVVIGGEVVTMHKVREAIKGGEVKITSCAPRAAAYLLEQLQSRRKE